MAYQYTYTNTHMNEFVHTYNGIINKFRFNGEKKYLVFAFLTLKLST